MPSRRATRFPRFGDLPEPFRVAVFQEAWRDRDPWLAPDGRRSSALRLVSREARAAVDSVVTSIIFWDGDAINERYAQARGAVLNDFLRFAVASELLAFLHAAGGGRFPKLREISLTVAHLDSSALATLRAGQWPHLEGLSLQAVTVSPQIAGQLAEAAADTLPALRYLYITGNHELRCTLQDEAAAALGNGCWPLLEVLDLSHNQLSAEAAAALAASAPAAFPKLTALNLRVNQLKDAGISALAAQAWPRLEVLDLQSNAIGNAGAAALAAASAAGRLPALRQLVLRYNSSIGIEGMRALTAAAWPPLESLQCGDLSVGGDAVEALAAAGKGKFPALQDLELDLAQDEAGQRLRDALAAAWPGIKLATHNTEYY